MLPLKIERWRLWARNWQGRAQAATSCLPEPAATPESLSEPRRFVTQILGALAAVPNPGPGAFVGAAEINDLYVPGKSLRGNWIGNTRHWIEQCSAQIDSAAKR